MQFLVTFRLERSSNCEQFLFKSKVSKPSFLQLIYKAKIIEKKEKYKPVIIHIALRPEGSENIPILFQALDLCFLNQNYIRNLKMGSKQSVIDPPQ